MGPLCRFECECLWLGSVGFGHRGDWACAGSRNRWRVFRCRCLLCWNRRGCLDGHVLGPNVMKHRVSRPGYLRKRSWTRLEVAIWLFALAFSTTSGIVVVTHVVGRWVLPVGGVIAAALGLMRYRAEAKQKKRFADHRDE